MAACACVCLGARTCGFRVEGTWVGERGDAALAQPRVATSHSGHFSEWACPTLLFLPMAPKEVPMPQ